MVAKVRRESLSSQQSALAEWRNPPCPSRQAHYPSLPPSLPLSASLCLSLPLSASLCLSLPQAAPLSLHLLSPSRVPTTSTSFRAPHPFIVYLGGPPGRVHHLVPRLLRPHCDPQIADFGLSVAVSAPEGVGGAPGQGRRYSACGTPAWTAPEVLTGDGDYDVKVDVVRLRRPTCCSLFFWGQRAHRAQLGGGGGGAGAKSFKPELLRVHQALSCSLRLSCCFLKACT